MKTKRSYPKTLLLMIFCVAFGTALIIPISSAAWGFISSNQDVPAFDAPVATDAPPEQDRPDWRPAFAEPVAPMNPRQNPLAPPVTFSRNGPRAFASADPMNSFVKKIQDAENEDEKQEAIDEARAALEKHYDRHIEGYQKQVAELEERLQNLRDQLTKRKDAKKRLVDLKLEMMISQADGLGWPEANRRSATSPGTGTAWRTGPSAAGFGFQSPPDVRPNRFVAPTVATSPRIPNQLNSFSAQPPNSWETKNFLEDGIMLLEQGEYGQFLDQYMEPGEFRKALKSKTLDQLSDQFQNERAQELLNLFRAAVGQPPNQWTPNGQQMSWQVENEDGETQELKLFRGKSGWFLPSKTLDPADK